jgi:hypothetical protein
MQLLNYSAIIKDCTFVGIVGGISLTSGNLQIGHATITNTVKALSYGGFTAAVNVLSPYFFVP